MFTFGIRTDTGVYNCFRCGNTGTWFQFKNQILKSLYNAPLDLIGSEKSKPFSGEKVFGD